VLNDAHAALLGEAWIGAARGCKNVAMLTLGTGVGGAVLCDGRLLRGAIGRAGHLGHVVVDAEGPPDLVNTPGSLEDAIGEYSLPARSDGRFKTTRDLLTAFRAGDAQATNLWQKSIHALAAALAGIINVVDPELIILGGGIAQAGDDLFVPLADAMNRFEWRPHGHAVKIIPAALGDGAGALGAAWNAMNATGEMHDAG
jgi:glucokinase